MLDAATRRLLKDWSLPVMILDRDLRFVFCNDAYLAVTHSQRDALLGEFVFDAFPDTEERIAPVLETFRQTLDGNITELVNLPFQLKLEDGTIQEVVWRATQDPLRDDAGNVVGLIQRAENITAQYELEQRNIAMTHELNHRVKNVMAVVSAIARITGRSATTLESYVKSFTDRLTAISATHDSLAHGDWRGLFVRPVLEQELGPYEQTDPPRVTLKGPRARLTIEATKDLSMVIHELATNAAKYGCLSDETGTLSVTWSREGDSLVLHWTESCDRDVTPPTTSGFGTRLFDMLPHITVEREFSKSGLRMKITLDGDRVFA